ncbi:OLC1v1028543C1 [Oldenlandia corymbosa var. corymbosa]|uniref:OLC1v1028543C1 n=1 Tax=Oldenlandia corymbosa var. corymbosa TaxID=529605 RepID=A0AAV1CD49_OLDCO|nr:OLC1v1028543C1 [Oldenlandia corymbosa var. corymbosa]
MAAKTTDQEPAIGIPYDPAYHQYNNNHPPPPQSFYYVGATENPYQAGMIPPNAVFGDPKGIPIQQTIYRDTPAPFNCLHCGSSALTNIKSKPSLAALVGCMMPMMLGVCFLCPSMDCLWHKYHYCPSCGEKVAEFEKSDPCLVMDQTQWSQPSFALPA